MGTDELVYSVNASVVRSQIVWLIRFLVGVDSGVVLLHGLCCRDGCPGHVKIRVLSLLPESQFKDIRGSCVSLIWYRREGIVCGDNLHGCHAFLIEVGTCVSFLTILN